MSQAFVVPVAPRTKHWSIACTPLKQSQRAWRPISAHRLTPRASAPVFAAGSSHHDEVAVGVAEAVSEAAATLSRLSVIASVAFVFVRSGTEGNARNEMRRVIDSTRRTLAARRVLAASTRVIGCTSGAFSGTPEDAAVSIALLHLPEGVHLHTFHIPEDTQLDMDAPPDSWWQLVGLDPSAPEFAKGLNAGPDSLQFFLLQHPDYERMLDLVAGLDFAFPNSAKVGAVAGRTQALHTSYVFDDDGAHAGGVVGLAFSGALVKLNVMLAQGARGVGPLMEVTEVKDGTEITKAKEIGTATEAESGPMRLLEMWHGTEVIRDVDYQLARKYLLLGLEVDMLADTRVEGDESQEGEAGAAAKGKPEGMVAAQPQEPDMVVRKVLGFNEATRSLAVEGADVRLGSRARFQVRDEQCARDELGVLFDRQSLEGVTNSMKDLQLIGGMVLADTERGEHLFGNVESDMDRRLFQERFRVPLCSLACFGQIGPLPAPGYQRHFPIQGVGVAASTFTHSSTALFVLFYGHFPKAKSESETA